MVYSEYPCSSRGGSTFIALELTTCGYAICALATYVFWWDKPYRAGERVRIVSRSTPIPLKGDVVEAETPRVEEPPFPYLQDRVPLDTYFIEVSLQSSLASFPYSLSRSIKYTPLQVQLCSSRLPRRISGRTRLQRIPPSRLQLPLPTSAFPRASYPLASM